MRHPYMTNAQRLASAQTMHDRATDDRPEDFLDTIEGEQWLADVSERLANGENIRWSMDAMGRRTVGVSYADLECRLRDSDCDAWAAACDAFMRATLRGDDDDYQAMAIEQSALRKRAREVAADMLAPLAPLWEEYQRQLREEA
jgi:hypothetical protein